MTRTVDDVLKVIEDDGFVSWKEIQNMRAEILALRAQVDAGFARDQERGAELDSLRAAVTWRRPIASAPQDGTKILVRQSFALDSEEAVSAERGGWATDDGSVLYGVNTFDEWLPVPGSAERHAAAIARAERAREVK